jgi:hypothetical protein
MSEVKEKKRRDKPKTPTMAFKNGAWTCPLCECRVEKKDEYFLYEGLHYCATCTAQKKKMIEDHKVWLEMCEYIRYKILGYDDTMLFPKKLALRLQGMRNGVFIKKGKADSQVDYTYQIIYYTFILKTQDIKYAFSRTRFKDEGHKINYMMQIIEGSINDVVLRIKSNEQNKKKIDEMQIENTDIIENTEDTNYIRKKKESNIPMDEFW